MTTQPFLGQLALFSFNFAPAGWALCNGQLMPINQHEVLFSLIGTQYGGNGQTTFALPDLRGRAPIHFGQGPGLSQYPDVGATAGVEAVTLTAAQMPTHSHRVRVHDRVGIRTSPKNNFLARPADDSNLYRPGASTELHPDAVTAAGENQAHENRMPLIVMNWCIALRGTFPSPQ